MSTDLGPQTRRTRVWYCADSGAVVDTTLDLLTADEVVSGLPLTEGAAALLGLVPVVDRGTTGGVLEPPGVCPGSCWRTSTPM